VAELLGRAACATGSDRATVARTAAVRLTDD
jgi:hypothetical protein